MKNHIDYTQHLNRRQFQAVQHTTGPALIIAGPGSGKTHTMVYRVAYLIEQGVKPWNILLLTFTKKAAKEMLGRVVHLVGEIGNKVQGGTFHSFAAKILFKHYDRLGYTDQISILGTSDQTELVGILRNEAKEDYLDQWNMANGQPPKLPNSAKFVSVFSAAVNKQKNIQDVLPEFSEFDDCRDVAVKMFFQYQDAKRDMNVLDYDDLLIELRRLFQENPSLKTLYGNKFQYIIIDEYQDTNIIQADIALQLASIHQNLVVVGDDCQSIYAFRGANIQNILTFTDAFPHAKIFHLTENYRSTPAIVEVANALIDKAEEKLEKELIAVSQERSVTPKIHSFPDQMSQAEWVVSEIQRHHRAGIPYEDIAVLYRNGYHANLLDMFLASRNIPYVKIGGVKLTESAHVKDLLAFLTVRVNPKDKISWRRLLTMFPGVGQKTAEKIIIEMEKSEEANGMANILATLSGKQKYKKSLRTLGDCLLTLNVLETDKKENHSPVRKVAEQAWEYYKPLFEAKFDQGEHEYRKFGIDHVLSYAENFESLPAFLAEFVLSEEQENLREKGDVLTLSTIHSAKGCEWKVVILIEAIEGAIPSYRAENIQEELRLFYVAVTRAKRYLFVTYPERVMVRGEYEDTEPSRFLQGLPYIGVE